MATRCRMLWCWGWLRRMNDRMKQETPLVCDASVVLNLGLRGGLTSLVMKIKATRSLVVTAEVEAELQGDDPDFYGRFLSDHFQMVREPLPCLPKVEQASLPDGLDAGEMSVLALCLERQWEPAIDERLGRQVARVLGMTPVGTLGLLQMACSQNWMNTDECLNAIQRVRANGFYCPKVLVNDDFPEYMARLL